MKTQNKCFISFSPLLSVWITSVIAMVNGADPAGMTIFCMCCTIGFIIGRGIRQAKQRGALMSCPSEFNLHLTTKPQDQKSKSELDALEPEFVAKQTAIDVCITAEDSNMPFLTDALRGIFVNECDDEPVRKERLTKHTRPILEKLFKGYGGFHTPTENDWGEPIGTESPEIASDMDVYPACFFKADHGYSVVFPDLSWLSTDGSTLVEARQRAVEILSCYLQWAREDGNPITPASGKTGINLAAIAIELESSVDDAWVEMVETVDIAEIENQSRRNLEAALDDELRNMAIQRLMHLDPSTLITQEEMDANLGITEKDLEGWESVEFDVKPIEYYQPLEGSYVIVAGAHGVGKSSFAGTLGYDPAVIHETTLDSQEAAVEILQAKADGLSILMSYIALDSVVEAQHRVRFRMEHGGHTTAFEAVQHSFDCRWEALKRVLPYCDTASFYDNDNGFVNVAEYRDGTISPTTENSPEWLREMLEHLNKGRSI